MSTTITPVPQGSLAEPAVRSFGMLSTFPPTPCGIATFAAALSAGLVANGSTVDVVRLGDAQPLEDPLVVAALGDGSRARRALCVDALNSTDVAIVQHEYGIYDGPDGSDVLGLMEELVVPVVLIAHTVVSAPSPGQRSALERACALADTVVVMTDTARERLLAGFDVDADKVIVIPHGAATPPASTAIHTPGESPVLDADAGSGQTRAPRLLTWGLLGPGKGIEWAIDAFALLDGLDPAPTYMIAGATHPKVRERTGEAYREMLIDRAQRSGSGSRISFDDSYRDLESLTDLIRSADLVVLPYDSADQVTSGVLVDAVAAGRPVVSTAFPHAIELLASGAGIVVPQRDPGALAAAIRSVLDDPDRASAMAAEARRLAPDLSWAAVAARYGAVGAGLLCDGPVSA
ncbi:MAG TPA: glycosyltransferase [Ilumatobacteraceae bacterium]|nr:glycosyltransferase [Ilumatobacteraceae bacterium]